MEICDPYSIFCKYYDSTLNHVNFPKWKNFILNEYLAQKKKNPTNIVDLGCGTGSLLAEFGGITAKKVGIDISEEMLGVARKNHSNLNFIRGDLQNFQLDQKADLLMSTHDTLNYLLSLKELEDHFQCVNSNLSPEGLYFFDVTSEYNLLENFHGKTIEENLPGGRLEWTNEYFPEEKKIVSKLKFMTNTECVTELHTQKYYPPHEILKILNKTGFAVLKIGSDYKKWKVNETASLINFLVALT